MLYAKLVDPTCRIYGHCTRFLTIRYSRVSFGEYLAQLLCEGEPFQSILLIDRRLVFHNPRVELRCSCDVTMRFKRQTFTEFVTPCYNHSAIIQFTERPSSYASRTLIPSGPPDKNNLMIVSSSCFLFSSEFAGLFSSLA